jgi:hypothetical protein
MTTIYSNKRGCEKTNGKGDEGRGERTYEPTGRPESRNLPVIISKTEIHRGRDDALSGLPAGTQLRKREAGGNTILRVLVTARKRIREGRKVVKREITI